MEFEFSPLGLEAIAPPIGPPTRPFCVTMVVLLAFKSWGFLWVRKMDQMFHLFRNDFYSDSALLGCSVCSEQVWL